ncbi:hypothetical protein LTS08_001222 [Lithohypha guttulata]|uniref:Uncharacterized protein n=1 Tax=Lithohypha guttulata TaxID=1690604 RepID=A0AAN7Y8T4_9EURO|nr:hypothetical protein LTR51_007777 [Lithohypha guttulata]KAK5081643.1 hypothetical protein LTR05_007776 [Lithohypha guttulata]KAK5104949.1 hypothetical protein LTS08_001222 [Lithohypha guttulata]
MQSILGRRSVAGLSTSPARFSRQILHPQALQAQRKYATDNKENIKRGPGGEPQGTTSRVPLIFAVMLASLLPLYYFTQATVGTGNKSPGAGQATIRDKRNEHGTENEYRDPRDSGKKTTPGEEKRRNNSGTAPGN